MNLSIYLTSRSPLDEETVHDSFNQLIAEQTQHGGGESEAFELQRLQRDLDDESRGSDAALSSSPLSFHMNI